MKAGLQEQKDLYIKVGSYMQVGLFIELTIYSTNTDNLGHDMSSIVHV